MKRFLIVLAMLAVLLSVAACSSGGTGDTEAIKDTIEGYVTAYNAGDFAKCLTYFTDFGEEDDALAFLSSLRDMSGELTLQEVKDISVSGQMATAKVVFTVGSEQGTDEMQLKKVQGQWRILWEQESLTGEAAAIRDTVVGYFAAYNAGDFAICLTYLTGFGDEQDAKDSLSLIKECIGAITFKEIGSVYVDGETANAHVDYVLWAKRFSLLWQFQKDGGAWRIETGYPTPTTLQALFPGTVDIAPGVSDVVEARHCVFEGDDGAQAWLWEAWQVRNTGDQTLHLNIVIEYYAEDDAFLGQDSFLRDLGPGEVEGVHGFGMSYALGYGSDPSHYKLIIESTG